jgi:hypothetical protein
VKRAKRIPETIAAELDPAEGILLFCIASGTSMAKAAGNSATTRSRLIVRGLIERDGSRFVITDQGRAVLAALLADKGTD